MAITQAIALFLSGKKRSRILAEVSTYESNLKAYYRMIKHLEIKPFQAQLLHNLQNKLKSKDRRPAFAQIEHLAKIVDYISNRNNAIFLVVNILTLWDYHCMIVLENWKQKSGRLLATWLNAVGKMEALANLAQIAHDYPDWAVPVVRSGEPFLSVRSIGHPLLTNERVVNDLTLRSPSGILLITGEKKVLWAWSPHTIWN